MGNFVTGTRVSSLHPQDVWRMLANVDRWPETFTPHLQAAHLEGPLRVGASGWVQTKLPLPRLPFTVTSLHQGRAWTWRGRFLWLTMDFDHRIEPFDGGSRITFDVDLNGPLAELVRPVARKLYQPQMERALDLLAGTSTV